MSIFSFFNSSKKTEPTVVTLPSAETLPSSEAEVTSTSVNENAQDDSRKPLTVSYATGWPIDIIYGYLHKNYEEQGFNDAMVKSDLAFRDMNVNIIKQKILMVFREINLKYDAMRIQWENQKNTCSAAGLLTTVSEIQNTLNVIQSHKEELAKLEQDFQSNANEASVPLQSYECGFLRGLATVAMSGGVSNNTISTPFSAPSLNKVSA